MTDVLSSGRVLGGRYRLLQEVARGGMAQVWAAEDPVLRRRVAVKILDPTLADDETVHQRFRHEAVAAARLAHPGIVATYDTGEDRGVAYIVMELVDGTTLRRLLDERGRLEVGDAAGIGAQVADALAHAHARGLVHRDVKPGNVLVEPDGRVKVTDFGIAKAAGSSELTRAGAVVGTARYLAPEQVSAEPVDERTDIYALGLVLYEMLCGNTPFDGESEIANAVARLHAVPVPVGLARPDVPRAVQEVIARCLARDPAGRPASAREVREALAPFRSDNALDLTIADALTDEHRTVGARPRLAVAPTPPPASPPTREQTSTDEDGAPVPSHGPHRVARTVVVALLASVAAVVALVMLTGGGGSPARKGTTGPAGATPTATHATLPIATAEDYDPYGDNKQEHHEEVQRLHDGNPATFWSTEHYNSRDFGNSKPGVGVWLRLTAPAAVRTVSIDAQQSGWNAQVYVADSPHATPTAWGDAVASGSNLPAQATLTITKPRTARYVLLWLTYLPPGNELHVAEVRLAS